MAPPLAVAVFPLTVEARMSASPLASTAIPPPLPPVTRLPATVEFWSARVPRAVIPPPRADAVLPSMIVL